MTDVSKVAGYVVAERPIKVGKVTAYIVGKPNALITKPRRSIVTFDLVENQA